MSAENVRAPRAARTENTLGRYQLVAPLGQGGMGTIYLAAAGGLADFHKLLVVKELRQDLSANRRFVEMFLDEAKLAARLNHPNVVQTIEAGQDGDRYFLSMEFLDGQPYSAIWPTSDQAPLVSLPIRLKILCEALAGLHYAHTLTEYDGRGLHIVHRDVSPQNIFVTYDGQVKVVDFGIAKAAVSTTLTSPGMFKGKFGYAAPEQVRGEEIDARTDVFAMGVILWETLTMQRFCDGVVNRPAVATRLAGKEPRASQVRMPLDRHLVAICDRALEVDPNDRFSSADEFRLVLEDYLVQCGQRVDPAAIKQVMAQKFATERRAIHSLIDRHIKHGAVEVSHVTTVALGTETGNNQATEIADLSNYVRNTTDATIVSDIASELALEPRPRSPRTIAVASAAAVVVLSLGFGLLRHSASGEQVAPPSQGAALTAVALPNTPTVVPAAEALRPQEAAKSAAAAEAARADVATAPPEHPVNAVNLTLEKNTHGARIEQAARLSSGARVTMRKVVRPHAVTATLPLPAVEQAAKPAPAPTLTTEAPVQATHSAGPSLSVGSDLNRVRDSHQRRSIDTEL